MLRDRGDDGNGTPILAAVGQLQFEVGEDMYMYVCMYSMYALCSRPLVYVRMYAVPIVLYVWQYRCLDVCIDVYVCMYVHISVCMYVCMYACMYVCSIYMYCMHACMYVCVCMYDINVCMNILLSMME